MKEISENKQHADEAAPAKHREHYGNNGNGSFTIAKRSKTERIIPAIDSAHAVAYAKKLAPTMGKEQILVVNVSGRGDKDVAAIARYRGVEIYE